MVKYTSESANTEACVPVSFYIVEDFELHGLCLCLFVFVGERGIKLRLVRGLLKNLRRV